MLTRKKAFCALLLLLVPLTATAATTTASGSARLQQFLENVHSFKADFAQTITHATLPGTAQSHGTVLIKRPNRFRWNYVSPDKQVIDSDGQHLWIYNASLEQVTVKPLKTTLANGPAMLLSGGGSLSKAFIITDSGTHDGLTWVTLKPKSDNAAFRKIQIGLDAKNIKVMKLTDAGLGQVTKIEFNNVVRNPDISDNAFRFTPPPGADVIGSLR